MIQSNNQLIALVDTNDNITGYDHKLKVHEKGTLHRAFSIFIFNKKGKMLIHQRAHEKYHSPGLWTNTCCSHLLENMNMEACVHDRLQHEMGFDADVDFQFKFTYRETFGSGLTEHETDHVYFGEWEGLPHPNPDEVADFTWVKVDDLIKLISEFPEQYTYWFKHIMNNFADKFAK
ncbi:MAG: isopentenyl-diphosphate Delta-isomerase [Salinivirgaceae bacterium]|jgi:isopentenyl-diphosphate delta-isomerase|nr:isopentenyl-diphosphate Delta-isomerase [Salinivirgaceae bacterium]